MNTLVKRLLIALGAGIVAFNLTALAAWESGRSGMGVAAHEQTDDCFREVAQVLDKYFADHQKLLEAGSGFGRRDGWGNPIVYEPHGKTYTLRSLGADGKPGGAGIDADSTYKEKGARAHAPTLNQFLSSPKLNAARQNFLTCCLVHGALWAFIVASSFKDLEASSIRRTGTVIGLLIVFAITLLGAIIQFSLELVPSGH